MSDLSITCSGCGLEYDWAPEYAGQSYPCECGTPLDFPQGDTSVSGTAIAEVELATELGNAVSPDFTKPTGTILDDEVEIISEVSADFFVGIGVGVLILSFIVGFSLEATAAKIGVLVTGALVGGGLLIWPKFFYKSEKTVVFKLAVNGFETKEYGTIRWVDIHEAKSVILLMPQMKGIYMVLSLRADSDARRSLNRRGGEVMERLKPKASKAAGTRCDVLIL